MTLYSAGFSDSYFNSTGVYWRKCKDLVGKGVLREQKEFINFDISYLLILIFHMYFK